MTQNNPCCVLTINSGSSSLKFAVYQMEPAEMLPVSRQRRTDRAEGQPFLYARDAEGKPLVDEHRDLPDHDAALEMLLDWLQERLPERRAGCRGPSRGSRRAGVHPAASDHAPSSWQRWKRSFGWPPSTCRTSCW